VLQAQSVGAGALDTNLGHPPVAGEPPVQALETSGLVGNDLVASRVPISSMTAATWMSWWVSTPP
jgi:hypothetical protein